MLPSLVKRLLLAIPLVLVVVLVNFIIIHTAPGDPVTYLYASFNVTHEEMEAIRESLGLKDPLHQQFIRYITSLLKGDFGYSHIYRTPVLTLIVERLPATVLLAMAALVFSAGIGVLLGAISAIHARTPFDYVISSVSIFGYCMPVFWLGILLILVFSVNLSWFPTMGFETLREDFTGLRRLADILHHLALPGFTLGVYFLATYARLTRASMLEVLSQDYVQTAWAKGLSSRVVYLKHALRNALLPIATVAGVHVGLLLVGATITETVFAWPGIGRLTYSAILQRDYPLLMGIFVFIAWSVILANLLADMIYTVIDPRIRYGE